MEFTISAPFMMTTPCPMREEFLMTVQFLIVPTSQ